MFKKEKNLKKRKNQGFTLIEFLIYSAIVVFVMSALTLTAINVLHARVRVTSMEEVEKNARFMFDSITHTIRNSEGIEDITEEHLTLEMKAFSKDPTEFYREGSDLMMERDHGAPARINTENVEIADLSFEEVYEGGVEVEMTVRFYNPSGRQEYDFEKDFRTLENVRRQPEN